MARDRGIHTALALIPIALATAPFVAAMPLAFVVVRRGFRRPAPMGLAPAGLVVLVSAFAGTLAHVGEAGAWMGMLSLVLMAGVMIAWCWAGRPEDGGALLAGAVAVLALEAGIAIVEVAFLGQPRAAGTTYHANVLGAIAALFGVWVVGAALTSSGDRRRRMARGAAALGLTMIPLVLSGSRGGMLAAGLGLIVFLGVHSAAGRPIRRDRGTLWFLLAGAVLVATALMLMVPEARQRWARLESSLDPEGRVTMWGIAAEGIFAAPLLGHGFGSWSRVAPAVEPSFRVERMASAHSGYLEIGLDGGFLLLLALVGGLWTLGAALVGRARAGSVSGGIAIAVLVVFACNNLVESFFQQAQMVLAAWLPIGLALVTPDTDRKQATESVSPCGAEVDQVWRRRSHSANRSMPASKDVPGR